MQHFNLHSGFFWYCCIQIWVEFDLCNQVYVSGLLIKNMSNATLIKNAIVNTVNICPGVIVWEHLSRGRRGICPRAFVWGHLSGKLLRFAFVHSWDIPNQHILISVNGFLVSSHSNLSHQVMIICPKKMDFCFHSNQECCSICLDAVIKQN